MCYVGSYPTQINQLEIDTKDKISEALATSQSLPKKAIFEFYKINSTFLLFNNNVKLQARG